MLLLRMGSGVGSGVGSSLLEVLQFGVFWSGGGWVPGVGSGWVPLAAWARQGGWATPLRGSGPDHYVACASSQDGWPPLKRRIDEGERDEGTEGEKARGRKRRINERGRGRKGRRRGGGREAPKGAGT